MIKTKIVATIGPACQDEQTIKSLIDNGVGVFRMNFSHGKLSEHAEMLEKLNQVRSNHHYSTAIMGDLCGPKIRSGKIEPEGEIIKKGDQVTIVAENVPGTAHKFGCTYENIVKDLVIDHRVLINDGAIALRVTEKQADHIICKVEVGGPMHSSKGMNLPDTKVTIPSITERDWECAEWAVAHKLHFLALSFVRSADDIKGLREFLWKKESDIKIVAKIEMPQAVEELESIVDASDGILVARGDLGVEMDLAEVPLIQKHITRLCRQFGKPVIVATQMLQSMIEAPCPTRAEVSDVANAIIDLTDAVMLSGETAVGSYPNESVQWLGRIAEKTELFLDRSSDHRPRTKTSRDLLMTASITRSVAEVADEINAKLVVAWSGTGATVRLLSKARLDMPIVALNSDERICQQMSMHYGVIPVCRPVPESVEQFAALAEELAVLHGSAKAGDHIVLLVGRPLTVPGTSNSVMFHTIALQES